MWFKKAKPVELDKKNYDIGCDILSEIRKVKEYVIDEMCTNSLSSNLRHYGSGALATTIKIERIVMRTIDDVIYRIKVVAMTRYAKLKMILIGVTLPA